MTGSQTHRRRPDPLALPPAIPTAKQPVYGGGTPACVDMVALLPREINQCCTAERSVGWERPSTESEGNLSQRTAARATVAHTVDYGLSGEVL